MRTILPEGHPREPLTISSRTAGSSDLSSSFHGVPMLLWQNLDMEHLRSSSSVIPGPSRTSHLSENGLRSALSFPRNHLWAVPSQNGAFFERPHLQRAYFSGCGISRAVLQKYPSSPCAISFSRRGMFPDTMYGPPSEIWMDIPSLMGDGSHCGWKNVAPAGITAGRMKVHPDRCL